MLSIMLVLRPHPVAEPLRAVPGGCIPQRSAGFHGSVEVESKCSSRPHAVFSLLGLALPCRPSSELSPRLTAPGGARPVVAS